MAYPFGMKFTAHCCLMTSVSLFLCPTVLYTTIFPSRASPAFASIRKRRVSLNSPFSVLQVSHSDKLATFQRALDRSNPYPSWASGVNIPSSSAEASSFTKGSFAPNKYSFFSLHATATDNAMQAATVFILFFIITFRFLLNYFFQNNIFQGVVENGLFLFIKSDSRQSIFHENQFFPSGHSDTDRSLFGISIGGDADGKPFAFSIIADFLHYGHLYVAAFIDFNIQIVCQRQWENLLTFNQNQITEYIPLRILRILHYLYSAGLCLQQISRFEIFRCKRIFTR